MTTTTNGKRIYIYTDGACRGNGKTEASGGWAFLVKSEDQTIIFSDSGIVKNTTNQRMELLAAINALSYVSKEFSGEYEYYLFSDSAYLINCYQQNWWKNWLKNNWLNSKKEPVKNRELWERLIPYFQDARFEFIKVKGHAGNKDQHSYWNNFVDKLAVEAKELKTVK